MDKLNIMLKLGQSRDLQISSHVSHLYHMDGKLYMPLIFWHQDDRVSHLNESTMNFIIAMASTTPGLQPDRLL